VLEFWNEVRNINSVITKYWPELQINGAERESKRKFLYQWKKESIKIKSSYNSKTVALEKIRPSNFGCVLDMNMENEIAFWIRSLRSEGIPISDSMIKT
jgi:hypothetical protein